MKKTIVFSVVSAVLFSFSSLTYACSGCKVSGTGCDMYVLAKDPMPVSQGCDTLEVIIKNTTSFQLELDQAYAPPGTSYGDTRNFSTIMPGQEAHVMVEGVDASSAGLGHDVVDTSIRYLAKYKVQDPTNPSMTTYANTGAAFTVFLKKKSCNIKTARLNMSDTRCYIHCRVADPSLSDPFGCKWGSCILGSVGYDHGTFCPIDCPAGSPHGTTDGVCAEHYDNYSSYTCHDFPSTNPTTPISSDSSVSLSPGLYVLGAKFNATADFIAGAEDTSKSIGFASYFLCDKSSLCSEGSGEYENCKNATHTHNKTAKLGFYIHASPIETLTISYPFNAQSPMGKLIKDLVYNHFDVTKLAKLGNYYSLTPLSTADTQTTTQVSFSSLCNSYYCASA